IATSRVTILRGRLTVRNRFRFSRVVPAVAVLILACASLARSQEPADPNARPDERQTVGTVTQAGRGSILVETDEGKVVIFALNPSVHIPKIAAGSRVRVITATSDT